MITVPSRVTKIIERLEAGEELTNEELQTVLRLQALDTAKLGEEYVREWVEREEQATESLRQALGA